MNPFDEMRRHIRHRTRLAFLRVLATYAIAALAASALLAGLIFALWRALHR